MVYKPGIPQPEDDMGNTSQPELLENFSQLDSQFGTNHVAFSASADNGKHSHVTYIRTPDITDSKLVPGEDEAIIYAAEDNDGNTELYYRQFGLTASQFTKAGSVFVGARPAAACNFNWLGSVGNCTVNSEYNLANIGAVQQTHASNAQFKLTFDTALPDADYYWTIDGLRSDSGSLVGMPKVNATYSSVVTATTFEFEYRNGSGSDIGNKLVRGTVVLWRMQ